MSEHRFCRCHAELHARLRLEAEVQAVQHQANRPPVLWALHQYLIQSPPMVEDLVAAVME
jgi:hypothetical protein